MPRQQHMASLVDGHGPTEIFEAGNCGGAWDAVAIAGGPVPAKSSLSLSLSLALSLSLFLCIYIYIYVIYKYMCVYHILT